MPSVSVVIPTYNREKFIGSTIKSVLQQSFTDYEILVVDDGSDDNTYKVVREFGDAVNYIYQENKGPSSARNKGIQLAEGKYIAFLDSDDQFLPSKLERQMDFIKDHPKCKFQYSWYYHVKDKTNKKRIRHTLVCKNKKHLQYALLARNFTIRTSTVLIEKKCFEKAGLFNENYLYSQDWDMWLRLAYYYYGYCIEEPLSIYRTNHGDNRSSHKVGTYHPEIRSSTLDLYGWSKKKLEKMKIKYEDSR